MPTIAIDVMGGDFAPGEIIKGVAAASRDYDARYILVGERAKIEHALRTYEPREETVEIVHTDESISMEESPRSALETKSNASITLAAQLVAQQKADVLLSAGSTGAVILAAARHIPMIEGVERSALTVVYPLMDFSKTSESFSLILDAGATIHCTVKHLVHFAIMGNMYSKYILEVDNPRVGLLNVGTEDTKGGHTLTEANKLLREIPGLNFIGNIEGNNIIGNAADVLVCEGMIGNIVLKMMQGAVECLTKFGKHAYRKNVANKVAMAILAPRLKKLRKKFDYTEYGGAPLLGFRKLCIKAHGKSNAKAIKNAISIAIKSTEDDMCEKIHKAVTEFNQKLHFDDIVE